MFIMSYTGWFVVHVSNDKKFFLLKKDQNVFKTSSSIITSRKIIPRTDFSFIYLCFSDCVSNKQF